MSQHLESGESERDCDENVILILTWDKPFHLPDVSGLQVPLLTLLAASLYAVWEIVPQWGVKIVRAQLLNPFRVWCEDPELVR
jgi:hypothetical protein